MDPKPYNSSTDEVAKFTLELKQTDTIGCDLESVIVITDTKPKETPYSVFTQREKWLIVTIVANAGLFSPLSSSIYFPAIPTLSEEFKKSTELINLTVTVYMIFQGISPMFWGTVSDNYGRRMAFVACLTTLAVTCTGLAMTPTSAYWLLMLLRCIQATGSASTVAIGAGVIGDIAAPEERGGFFGLYGLGPLLGPAIGPVIGGGLLDTLGWRSIFWFMCIGASVWLVVVILILPETLRLLVGNGSQVPSKKLHRPVFQFFAKHSQSAATPSERTRPAFKNPLRIFTYFDVTILLFQNGVIYAVFCTMATTISTLFKHSYPNLSATQTGLCFLASGGGMFVGCVITGKLLNRDYMRMKKEQASKLMAAKSLDGATSKTAFNVADKALDVDFPIEEARLRRTPLYIVIFALCTMTYGLAVHRRMHLAVPLILQFFIGYTSISILGTTQTLIIDLVHNQSSSVTACNNLIRCSFAAALVSVIQLIISGVGPAWTYFIFGSVSAVLTLPAVYLQRRIGPSCRAKRNLAAARL